MTTIATTTNVVVPFYYSSNISSSSSSNNNNSENNISVNGHLRQTDTEIEDEFYNDMFTILCYSLIIIVSLCGNSLVLKVIASRQKLQTTTNILIASLAFADVLTTTLNVPFNVVRFIWMNYPFPALFCKLVPFIQVACVYVSTLTMGVIAIHRHITLSNAIGGGSGGHHGGGGGVGGGGLYANFNKFRSHRLGVIIAVVWLLAGFCAIPHSIFNEIVYAPYRNVSYRRCRAEYPKLQFNLPLWLSVEAFLTQYL